MVHTYHRYQKDLSSNWYQKDKIVLVFSFERPPDFTNLNFLLDIRKVNVSMFYEFIIIINEKKLHSKYLIL